MRNFRKFNLLFLVMIFLLAISLHGPLMAQDDLMTNTPVAEVTPEPVVTPAPADEPADSPFAPITDNLIEIVLLVAVVILALQYKNVVPVDTVDKVLSKAFGYAKEVTARIPGELDDQAVKIIEEAVRRIIRDEMASTGIAEEGVETSVDVPAMDAEYYRSKFGRSWNGEPPII